MIVHIIDNADNVDDLRIYTTYIRINIPIIYILFVFKHVQVQCNNAKTRKNAISTFELCHQLFVIQT